MNDVTSTRQTANPSTSLTNPHQSPVPGEPSEELSPLARATFFGAAGGIAGKVATNNVNKMIENYQSGHFKWDFSRSTLAGQMIGSVFQVGATYGTIALLGADDAKPGSAQSFLSYGGAGVAGAAFSHLPAQVFYLNDQTKLNLAKLPAPRVLNWIPEVRDVFKVMKFHPEYLKVGLVPKLVLGFSDWGGFLGGRAKLEEHFINDYLAEHPEVPKELFTEAEALYKVRLDIEKKIANSFEDSGFSSPEALKNSYIEEYLEAHPGMSLEKYQQAEEIYNGARFDIKAKANVIALTGSTLIGTPIFQYFVDQYSRIGLEGDACATKAKPLYQTLSMPTRAEMAQTMKSVGRSSMELFTTSAGRRFLVANVGFNAMACVDRGAADETIGRLEKWWTQSD